MRQFWGVQLAPAKTAKKAEKHSTEGPTNAIFGKFGVHAYAGGIGGAGEAAAPHPDFDRMSYEICSIK